MQKLIESSRFGYLLLPSISQNCHSNPIRPLLSLLTSSQKKPFSSAQDTNPKCYALRDYLIGSLKFSNDRARVISNRFLSVESLEKPEKVVCFFEALGFSDAHIQALVNCQPKILFANVEKTIKPKIIFFEELGLCGPHLGAFLSKCPNLLHSNLDRSLIPCFDLIKKVLSYRGRNASNANVNDDVFRTLTRCNALVQCKSRLEANIQYLKSCGVVGSQLSALFFRQTRLFTRRKEKLAEIVSRALELDVAIGSGTFAHAIQTLSCMSAKNLNDRFGVLSMLGFSKDEIPLMFKKAPIIFALSNAKLKKKIEFFLKDLKISRSVLVRYPVLLQYSIEERVRPRYKVMEMLRSRGLLTRELSVSSTIILSNNLFLERYILTFKKDAKELLLAYNDRLSGNNEK